MFDTNILYLDPARSAAAAAAGASAPGNTVTTTTEKRSLASTIDLLSPAVAKVIHITFTSWSSRKQRLEISLPASTELPDLGHGPVAWVLRSGDLHLTRECVHNAVC